MVRKIVHDMQGSALAMVIILITILSTLGLAVMTLGFAHYKVGMADKKAKLSFYMAESGLEQAYKIMLEEVAEAMKAGNEKVNMVIEKSLCKEAEMKDNNENTVSNYVNKYYYDEVAQKYVIVDADWEQIQIDIENNTWVTDLGSFDLQNEFKQAYKNHFNTMKSNQYQLVFRLTDPDEYENIDFNVEAGEGEVNKFSKPRIEASASPSLPNFFAAGLDSAELTLLSTYGISAEGLSEEGKVPQKVQMTFTIKMPTDEEILKNNYYYVYQEVIETNKANDLWHNALVAYGDLQVNAFNVNIKGKIYAKGATDEGGFILGTGGGTGRNVLVNGDVATPANVEIAAEAQGCAMNIYGNVYADNVLIRPNSDNNEINIRGNVYTKDDLELNGSRAKIAIEGNFYGFSDGSYFDGYGVRGHDQSSGIVINAVDINQEEDGSSLEISGEVFINGVSYVDVAEPYPTGESVSIKGNYRAYSHYLLDDDYEYEFGYYNPLTLVNKRKNKVEGEWISMEVPHKVRYFYKLCGEPTDPPSWFNKGLNVKLPSTGQIYTLGTYINQGNVGREGGWKVGDNVEGKVLEYSEAYEASLLNNFAEYIEIKNEYKSEAESEYVFFSQSQDVYLIGLGGDNADVPEGSEGKIFSDSATISGIIVTEKNVYLRGEINFNGLIVAGGNIYIEDSYPKKITADWYYVFEKMNKEVEDEKDPFKYSDDYVHKVIESSLEVTEPTSVIPYKQYITIDQWKKI